MNTESILTQFYSSFAKRDLEGMLSCYHPEVTFSDPAFGQLKGDRAKAMWAMLLSRAKSDLNISFEVLESSEQSGKVNWKASYEYGPQKRTVNNDIIGEFQLKDGKIFIHNDHFNLWKWSSQALGPIGMLLGWSSFMRNKIQAGTSKALDRFMEKGK